VSKTGKERDDNVSSSQGTVPEKRTIYKNLPKIRCVSYIYLCRRDKTMCRSDVLDEPWQSFAKIHGVTNQKRVTNSAIFIFGAVRRTNLTKWRKLLCGESPSQFTSVTTEMRVKRYELWVSHVEQGAAPKTWKKNSDQGVPRQNRGIAKFLATNLAFHKLSLKSSNIQYLL